MKIGSRYSTVPEFRPPRIGGNCDLKIEVITDGLRFAELHDEWNRLIDVSPATPFQTFEWCSSWWKYFGRPGRQLHILLFRKGDELVGLAPMFLEILRLCGKEWFKQLKFLGCDVPDSPVSPIYAEYALTDYLDLIVRPGYEDEVATALVGYLEGRSDLCDEVQFMNLQRSGFLATAFLRGLVTSGLQHKIRRADICPRIVLRGSFKDYLGSLDGSHRRRIRKALLTIENGIFEVCTPVSAEEMQTLYANLVDLHQRRWNRVGSPGLFYDKRFELFLRDVVEGFDRRGWVWLRGVKGRSDIVSVRLAFRFKNVLFDYVSGVDDLSVESKHGPGIALLASAIRDCCMSGGEAVDLLRGGEEYKLQVANDLRYNWRITVINPTTHATLRARLYRGWRAVERTVNRARRELLIMRVAAGQRRIGAPVFYVRHRLIKLKEKFASHNASPLTPGLQVIEKMVRRPLERVQDRAPLAKNILRSLKRDEGIPFTRKVFKGVVFIKSLLLSRLYLHPCDRVGRRCRTRGKPYIVNDGSIVIGDDFNLSSRIVRSELATGHRGRLEIGDDVSVNFGALLSSQNRVSIGSHVRIGPYSIITDSDFHTVGHPYEPPTGTPTIIEDHVWLGARVTVLKGSRIGRGSVISAGSVVAGTIPPGVIAGGVPARVLKSLEPLQWPHVQHRTTAETGGGGVVDRVLQVFTGTFGTENPDLSWGPRQIPLWDSLGHLKLITNLESEFGIRIKDHDVIEILTIRDACRVVEQTLMKACAS